MRPPRVCDVECYRNYFLVKFRDVYADTFYDFETWDGGPPLDLPALAIMLQRSQIITFNGNNYDVPMISAALCGWSCSQLKDLSDKIIVEQMKYWDIERAYGVYAPPYLDHIDLIEVAPGVRVSLKIYGGRLNSKRMQDLPIEPSAIITAEQRPVLNTYCGNDLLTTIDLYHAVKTDIALREKLSAEYGIDLRSKSDAQIAESVIKQKIGFKVNRPTIAPGTAFRYRTPEFVRFLTPACDTIRQAIEGAAFVVNSAGSFDVPKPIEKTLIRIGMAAYQIGNGGLHSTEKSISHYSDDEYEIRDIDVKSYYPAIMLRLGIAPAQLTSEFLRIFKVIVDQRLAAKTAGDKATADSLKITINGTFGKLGSKWSVLYAPDLMIQVTVTGQLCLLMLIELLELSGIQVVSANTDGLVVRALRTDRALVDRIIAHWERATSFEMERAEYASYHARDVNNYLALTTTGEFKSKGVFAKFGLKKTPDKQVCVDAVMAYIRDRTPIAQTVLACQDIRKFVVVRHAAGGATKDGEYLGKAVRWYFANGEHTGLHDARSGNQVAGSMGAQPCMTLPDSLPGDIDYPFYINETLAMLADIGLNNA